MPRQHLFGLADTKVEHFSIPSKFILAKTFKKLYLCKEYEREKPMDSSIICSKLQDLLIKNEKVTLPGVGELVIESQPATFLQEENKIFPPRKELVFVPSPYAVSTEEFLKNLSGKIMENLALEGEFEIQGFGKFSDNGGGEVKFTVNEDFDFAPDNFSLESIALEPNMPATQETGETLQETWQAAEMPAEQETTAEPEGAVPEPAAQPAAPTATARERHDVAAKKETHRKWMMWLLVAIAALAVIILFIILFKEDLQPLLQKILYTKEELEIMKEWATR